MREDVRNVLIYSGMGWTLIWVILWLFGIISFWRDILYELPGIILIIIALYNWDNGDSLEHKQDTPIENENFERNTDAI